MSVWKKFKKAIKKNIVPIALSPFTAGASLAFMKDTKGNTAIDYVTGAKSAREQNEKNRQLQEQTNAQAIELANTAHQREVADLQAAGLNPVLSAGGSGAATPTLGTAHVENEMPGGYLAQVGQIANVTNTFSSAKQANSQANLNNVNAQIQPEIAKAQIAADFANAGSAKATADYTNTMKDIDKALKESETESNKWENKINKDLGTSKNDNGIYRAFKNSARSLFDKTYNPLKNTIE